MRRRDSRGRRTAKSLRSQRCDCDANPQLRSRFLDGGAERGLGAIAADLLARLSKRKEWTRLMETAAGISHGALDVALWLQLREMRAAGFQAAADGLRSVAVAPVSVVAPTTPPAVTVVSTPAPSNSSSAAAAVAAPAAPAAPSVAVEPPQQRAGTRLAPSALILVQQAQQQVEEGIQQVRGSCPLKP